MAFYYMTVALTSVRASGGVNIDTFLGYGVCANEDEARGRAVGRAIEVFPGRQIVNVAVGRIPDDELRAYVARLPASPA